MQEVNHGDLGIAEVIDTRSRQTTQVLRTVRMIQMSAWERQGELPDGVVTLEFHDGMPVGDVTTNSGRSSGTRSQKPHCMNRWFELTDLLGCQLCSSVRRAPEASDARLAVSLHPDFGYNGFDFSARPTGHRESLPRRCSER